MSNYDQKILQCVEVSTKALVLIADRQNEIASTLDKINARLKTAHKDRLDGVGAVASILEQIRVELKQKHTDDAKSQAEYFRRAP